MIEQDDRLLAALAQKGDHAAFTTLMARHKHWLLRSVRRYVRDEDDALDILQESFIAAWFAIGRYDLQRPFGIWLRRIALNKCRDHGRRNIVYRAAVGSFTLLSQITGAATQQPVSSRARGQAAATLDTAIARLPESVRYPLILTAIEGLSHKEAAEVLKLTAKAIEVRVYRAKKLLAESLSPDLLADLVEHEQ
ncbi:MAG: sigma-70 family RNA polymerase sigma factor [Candidatus Andeanibacterium colombiense]|uniref:Sigma-70 family RNA polymerase sigma factor n=1 Tax=Candidatus Andeanibacterium colombiense TaxID=3121345 RepID=A0AAJ5XAY0_9SPHN|nr:MAG: sigma-70 family RNA polymerase sigma factor [Sphingomonadaceae bacterium]